MLKSLRATSALLLACLFLVPNASAGATSNDDFYTLTVSKLRHTVSVANASPKVKQVDLSLNSTNGTQQFYIEVFFDGVIDLKEFDSGSKSIIISIDRNNDGEGDSWVSSRDLQDGEVNDFNAGNTSEPKLNLINEDGSVSSNDYCSELYQGLDLEKKRYFLVFNANCLSSYSDKVQLIVALFSQDNLIDSVSGEPISALWVDRVDCNAGIEDSEGTIYENGSYYVCYKGSYFSDVAYKANLMNEGFAYLKKKKITDPFIQAYYKCLYKEPNASIADKNRTIVIDGAMKNSNPYYVSAFQVACIYKVLSVPTSVKSMISNTRALDGMKTATFSKYKITWSYHPDSGLNLILQKK